MLNKQCMLDKSIDQLPYTIFRVFSACCKFCKNNLFTQDIFAIQKKNYGPITDKEV